LRQLQNEAVSCLGYWEQSKIMKRPIKRWLCVSRILVAIHTTLDKATLRKKGWMFFMAVVGLQMLFLIGSYLLQGS
uniref:KGW motif small protein n=1 Tax=Acinetobacter sp. TaxID=472 RepID=UPI003917E9AC